MEAKLHKLKVTDLKELLAKHHLVQTGKKDDLIKRLMENNVSVDDDGNEEELTDPEPRSATSVPAATAHSSSTLTTAAGSSSNAAEASSSNDKPSLTSEQQAMKARAERFGIPFNPNSTPRSSAASKPAPETLSPASKSSATTPQKAPAIDKAPLGISDDVLAKRAAKFGVPEKKTNGATPAEPSKQAETPKTAEPELTPEVKEQMAAEEEKKRKRAEKFGTTAPSSGGAGEVEAKKAKA